MVAVDSRQTWFEQDYLDQRAVQVREVATALGSTEALSPSEFAAFWSATYERLGTYHKEAGDQLRSSYRLAQVTALAGFGLVLGLGIATALARSTAQGAFTGAVAAVGGALAAFIGRTFHVTYQRALAQRMAYFDEPLMSARLLAAERLLKEFPEGSPRRDDAILRMVEAAVRAPQGRISPRDQDSQHPLAADDAG